MKNKFTIICFFLLFASAISYSQKSTAPQSIISRTAMIKKYYDRKELAVLSKNELVELCIERVGVLTKIMPYVSLATKSGVTMTEFGIPNNSEYRKVFESQEESINNYLESTNSFQRKILPYSDKDDLIKAVLFYETILKLLNEFKDL
nr:hypothetical protein [uncultured Flavobacterium sp.]